MRPHVLYEDYKKRALLDPKFRRLYEQPSDDVFVETALALVRLRHRLGLTQAELARKVGTSQQAIARVESLDYRGHSLATLQKIAAALDKKVRIEFV